MHNKKFKDKKKSEPKPSSPDETDEINRRLFLEAIEKIDPVAVKTKMDTPVFDKDPSPPKKTSHQRSMPSEKIDLHGMTLADAQIEVDRFIQGILRRVLQDVKLRIITGKGLHSGNNRAVLASEIYTYVCQKYARQIVSIDESPANVKLGGIPIRGHFDLVLKR